MYNNCKSCGSILTIERLICPRPGTNGLNVCLSCLVAALEEILREYDILPPTTQPASEAA